SVVSGSTQIEKNSAPRFPARTLSRLIWSESLGSEVPISKPRSRNRWGVSAWVSITIAESCNARACALTVGPVPAFWAMRVVPNANRQRSDSTKLDGRMLIDGFSSKQRIVYGVSGIGNDSPQCGQRTLYRAGDGLIGIQNSFWENDLFEPFSQAQIEFKI